MCIRWLWLEIDGQVKRVTNSTVVSAAAQLGQASKHYLDAPVIYDLYPDSKPIREQIL